MLKLLNERFDFSGVKIALFKDNQVLTILRDDKFGLPYANMWELPGGGREAQETPFECVQREVFEELGILIRQEQISWSRVYQGMLKPEQQSVFMVGDISCEQLDNIVFGDEGQEYRLMSVEDFLSSKQAIPQLQARLRDYLEINR